MKISQLQLYSHNLTGGENIGMQVNSDRKGNIGFKQLKYLPSLIPASFKFNYTAKEQAIKQIQVQQAFKELEIPIL